MIRYVVRGIGQELNKRVMKNKEFEGIVEKQEEWIVKSKGISERKIEGEGEKKVQMGEDDEREEIENEGIKK